MKAKRLKPYLEKRLSKSEIAEVEAAAQLEFEVLAELQEAISKAVIKYMSPGSPPSRG